MAFHDDDDDRSKLHACQSIDVISCSETIIIAT